MEFGCLIEFGRHTAPLPIPDREVKPHIADDTALVGYAYVLFVLRFAIECSLNILHILGKESKLSLRSTSGTPVEK